MHTFKKGDVVTIFQMSPSKGLFIEGKAVVTKKIADIDEQYEVIFVNEPGEIYQRFVDRAGQGNPKKYLAEFNLRLGYLEKP